MGVAQALYENGFITYMRTDSPVLSSNARDIARALVGDLFGGDYLSDASDAPVSKQKKDSEAPKNAQEAHEAIRPAEANGKFRLPRDTNLSGDELRLYSLVVRRTLASVMKPSLSDTKTLTITATNAPPTATADYRTATFRSSDTVVTFKGYLAAMDLDQRDTTAVSTSAYNSLKIGQRLKLVMMRKKTPERGADATTDSTSEDDSGSSVSDDADGDQAAAEEVHTGLLAIAHRTRPPSRYTEASFIQQLEVIGVGRPSTYSKVMQILKEREYVLVDRQTVVPKLSGLIVSALLQQHFFEFFNAEFTAQMEAQLDAIAHGKEDKVQFLRRFYIGDEHSGKGLLTRVSEKVRNDEIDQRDSRALRIPHVQHLGVFQLSSRGGVYLEKVINDSAAALGAAAPVKYKIPIEMQEDIRCITTEAVEQLLATGLSSSGEAVAVDPATSKTVYLKGGPYGAYLQVGENDEKEKRYHSVPGWARAGTLTSAQFLELLQLPRSIGTHPEIDAQVLVEVDRGKEKSLCVGLEGFPGRYNVSHDLRLEDITMAVALAVLPDVAQLQKSADRDLGQHENSTVSLRLGRFGHYLKWNDVVCGIGKRDPDNVTLEDAVLLVQRKAARDAKGGKKKTAVKKVPAKSATKTATKKAAVGKSSKKKTASDDDSSATLEPKTREKTVDGAGAAEVSVDGASKRPRRRKTDLVES